MHQPLSMIATDYSVNPATNRTYTSRFDAGKILSNLGEIDAKNQLSATSAGRLLMRHNFKFTFLNLILSLTNQPYLEDEMWQLKQLPIFGKHHGRMAKP